MRIAKPDRNPDFTYEIWSFYFEEMVQYNNCNGNMFKIRLNDDNVEYYDNEAKVWESYAELDCKKETRVGINNGFKEYLDKVTETFLLEQ